MDNTPEAELEGGAESPQEQNEPENVPDKTDEDIEKDRDKTWMRLYNFTEEQLTELKEVFAMCDREDNGMICAPDVGTALRAMGQNPTEAELVEMLQEANLDDAGQMSLDEFMRLIGHKGLKTEFEMEEEFEEALKVFDHENVGLIEASELKHAMKAWGEPIDDDDIAEMLKVADVAPDGKIDYMEFIRKILTK